ncbi:MAG: hypothetical protein ACLFTT_07510 [Candidatus Hydrogenedentota bacterium]
MLHPFEKITPHMFRLRVVLFAVAALLLGYALVRLAEPFASQQNEAGARYGILSFEFAATAARAERILETWGHAGVRAAQVHIWLDYAFLLAYSTAFAAGCVWALRRFARHRGPETKAVLLGRLLAFAMWGAGLCDALENAALLRMLYAGVEPAYPAIAFVCAAVKFILLGAGTAYIAAGIFAPWFQVPVLPTTKVSSG